MSKTYTRTFEHNHCHNMAAVKPEINQVVNHSLLFKSSHLKKVLRWQLFVSQVFGVAPLGANCSVCAQRLHHCWCFSLVLFIWVITIVQIVFDTIHRESIERILFLSRFIVNCILVAIIVLTAKRQAVYFSSIPRELMQLVYALQQQQRRQYRRTIGLPPILDIELLYRKSRILTMILAAFFSMCCFTSLSAQNYNLVPTLRTISAYILPHMVISLNLAQYWFLLLCMRQLYACVNRCLNDLLIGCQSVAPWYSSIYHIEQAKWFRREFLSNRMHTPTLQLIEGLREIYSQLDALTLRIIDVFSLIMLINILSSFFDLCICLFLMYKHFNRPHESTTIRKFNTSLWVVFQICRLFFMLLPNHDIINEKCRTAFALNSLNSVNMEMEYATNCYLMQLMVRNQSESAFGIVELNLMLIGGLCSGLAMYITFLVQIDLGNESLIGGSTFNKTARTA